MLGLPNLRVDGLERIERTDVMLDLEEQLQGLGYGNVWRESEQPWYDREARRRALKAVSNREYWLRNRAYFAAKESRPEEREARCAYRRRPDVLARNAKRRRLARQKAREGTR